MIHSSARFGALAVGLAAAPAALAQTDLDLQAPAIVINQSIQTGTTLLVGGKTTVVRVPVQGLGTIPAGAQVDGLLRVFVGGVEVPESPLYSINGPIDVTATPSPGNENDSLNFTLVAPESTDVEFVAEINPLGPNQLDETDFGNNTVSSGSVDFACVGVPDVVYVPIDYRPGGGSTPNLPPEDRIVPGAGDNFFTGSFPGRDVEYRRSDFPSKLWTSSLSGSGSALNSSLLIDLQMMNPQPDFIYGWVPGSLPYNGQAIGIPGQAGMGNTQDVRYQRTMAHEVGHLIGLFHTGDKINNVGFDVEHQLNFPLGLGVIKTPGLNDIMVAGQITSSAWIDQGTYNQAINHPAWSCAGLDFAEGSADGPWNAERMLIAGVVQGSADSAVFTDVVTFAGGRTTAGVPLAEANVVLRAWVAGEVAYELPLSVHSSADHCEECRLARADADAEFEPADAGFAIVLPATLDPKRVERVELSKVGGAVLAQAVASANAPTLEITSPKSAEGLGDVFVLEWQAGDVDGDALRFSVRYTADGERMVPVATQLESARLEIPFGELATPQTGRAYFEVLASDGLHTTRAKLPVATPTAFAGGGSTPPFTYVMTPDPGKSFPFGGNVLLHGTSHDLEDGPLDGVWTSDVDGPVATGRVASVADLSVGTHVLSFTATDTSGVSSSASTTITITDRLLPGGICQTDLGFGGPGTASLSVCGGDLSSGTTADIALEGAAPNETVFVGISAVNVPTPLLGGTVITFPLLSLLVETTDASGDWTLADLPGGGGPVTFYLQAVYGDAAQATGFGISNAVQVDFLP
ncbi:MAG: hypothetical protein ACYSWX_10540 [Planctomycetota bacterium]|jgi:hypothetical protein